MAAECRLRCTLVALGPVSWEQLAKLRSQEKMNKGILQMRQSCLVSCNGTEQWWNCPWMWQSASGRETESGHCTLEGSLLSSFPSARCCTEAQLHIQQTVQLRESSEHWLSPCLLSLSWIRATTLLWWWAWICFDSSLLLLVWPGDFLTISYWTQSFPIKPDSR